jgi:type VI secretion system protein ImpH
MTSFGWRRPGALENWVTHEAYRFEFAQAVRLLEAAAYFHADSPPIPLGQGSDPQREAVRLRAAMNFKFPPRELSHASPSTPERPAELVANFFRLAGANAPLPDWVTELLLQQQRIRDDAMRDFLDIFHHRLLALLYRQRLHTRPWLDPALLQLPEKEQHEGSPRIRNTMAQHLLCFAGLGLRELQGRLGVKDEELLPYAGLLWHRPRSIYGLVRLLEHAFGIPIKAHENLGVWRTIEPEDRTHLGARPSRRGEPSSHDSGRNHMLGRTAVLGRRVWDSQGRFDFVLGPLSLPQYERFLPGQPDLKRFAALVRFYAGDLMDVGIHLCLKQDEAPAAEVGTAQLGWKAWVQPTQHPGLRTIQFLLPT